jgi:hypothetical protein
MTTATARAFFKKTTLFATAFVLAVSTMTAAVPFILSEEVSAASTVHTTSLAPSSGWNFSETRATGHNELVPNGLRAWTEGSTTTDKAAGYYATPGLLLDDVDSTSIDFASFSGTRPGIQLRVDRDGNGTFDGTLVYEPWSYAEGFYWTNGTGFGVDNGTGNMGYKSYGTLAQYQAANPSAQVSSIGYSLGSGVKGDAVISKITIGETAYTFDALPPATPTNLLPPTGTTASNPNFSMSWNTVSGASVYQYRTSNAQVNETTLGPVIYSDDSSSSNYTIGANTVTRANSNTPQGDYFWQVRAGAGNNLWSDWSVINKVTVDTTAPTKPTNFNPSNGSVQSSTVTFDWLASTDATAVTYDLQYSTSPSQDAGVLNGAVKTVNGISATEQTVSGLETGYIYWQVRAKDAAGQYSQWSDIWGYEIDATAPNLSISTPTNGELFGGLETHSLRKNTISVKATASDANGLKAYCVKFTKVGSPEGSCVTGGYFNVLVNGTMPTVNISTTNLASGEYVVKARVTDSTNNFNEQTRTVLVDNTKPVLSTPVVEGSIVKGTTAITLNAEEANPKIYSIRVLDSTNTLVAGFYDANSSQNSVTLNWNTTDVDDGTYTIQFSARDAVGNSATSIVRRVVVDNNGPAVNITSPTQSTFGNVDGVDVTATTGDAVRYEIYVNGTLVESAQTPFDGITVNTTAGGTYLVEVKAYDQSNNEETDQVSFTVDNTEPTLQTDLEDDSTVSGVTTITSEVTDGDPDTYILSIYDDEGDLVLTTDQLEYTFNSALIDNGDYTAVMTAEDEYGNEATRTVSFAVFNQPVVTNPGTNPTTPTTQTPVPVENSAAEDVETANTVLPTAINPSTFAGILGNATDNTAAENNGGAGVEGATTENNIAQAADSEANQGSFMGLGWYWWLLILAALAAIAWWIAAARKRNAEN